MFFPLALVGVKASLARAPVSLDEVARSLGQPRLAVLCRVTLRLTGPGLVAAFCLVFLSVITELTATLILIPTGVQTLASQFWCVREEPVLRAGRPVRPGDDRRGGRPELGAGPVLRSRRGGPEDDDMTQLAVAGLDKRFGAHQVLAGLNIDVPAGSLTAILGPVRQRQDHPAAGAGRVRARGRGHGPDRARGRRRAGRVPPPGTAADRLRAPGRQPVPAPHRGRQRRVRAEPPQVGTGPARQAQRGPAGGGRPGRPSTGGTRTSSPAGSSSGSRWPGRSPSRRRSSCSTSRSPPSTRTCAPVSGPTCSSC